MGLFKKMKPLSYPTDPALSVALLVDGTTQEHRDWALDRIAQIENTIRSGLAGAVPLSIAVDSELVLVVTSQAVVAFMRAEPDRRFTYADIARVGLVQRKSGYVLEIETHTALRHQPGEIDYYLNTIDVRVPSVDAGKALGAAIQRHRT